MTKKIDGVHCDGPGCDQIIKNHVWGRIRSKWCEMKNGKHYCPEHYPDWYLKWTRRKDL